MTWLTLIEGYMPIQAIVEVAGCLLLFSGINYFLKKSGIGISTFWSALLVWAFIQIYLHYRIYPPLPFSVLAIYGVVSTCGVFLWVSGSEKAWGDFKRPILEVLDGATLFHRSIRLTLLTTIPLALAASIFSSMIPNFPEPVELRTPFPAPPRTTIVHGETFSVQDAPNPFRVNEKGEYDPAYTNRFLVEPDHSGLIQNINDPRFNPWTPNATEYMKAVLDGGHIYFQNCHFCHGAEINGRGMFAFAFNPIPVNIKQIKEVLSVLDSRRFWRVAHGGMGLPGVAFPWASTMPPFQELLEIDDIWKVVLFEFWHTGTPAPLWLINLRD